MDCAVAAFFYIVNARHKMTTKALTMAHAAQINGIQLRSAKSGDTFLTTLRARYEQYRLYRQTVKELSELSGRELADLGLSRSGIRGKAIEVVYGA